MIVNANSIVQHVIQIKNGIIIHVNVNVKKYRSCKEHCSWNPSTCISGNTSLIEYDEVIIVGDIVSRKKKNTVATNVTSTASTNCHSKTVKDCYILHTVLLVIILLLIIDIIVLNKKH